MGVALEGRDCSSLEEPGQCGLANGLVFISGVGIALTSVPFLATGIPMVVVGSNRVRKTRQERTALNVKLAPTFDRPGVALSGTW